MDNNFKEQLSKVSKSHDDIYFDNLFKKIDKLHQEAQMDYTQLKKMMLNYSKEHGYIIENNKKIIKYYFSSSFTSKTCGWYTTAGPRKTIFGSYKPSRDNNMYFQPRDEYDWDTYLSEITRLCNEDGIDVTPVIHSNNHNIDIRFPTATTDKRFLYGASLMLKCIVELD